MFVHEVLIWQATDSSLGIIKDGSVSGQLPSLEDFSVYYPGYSSTISRSKLYVEMKELLIPAGCSHIVKYFKRKNVCSD